VEAIPAFLFLMLELMIGIMLFLVEMTVMFARVSVAPLKFLFSPTHRNSVRRQWRGRPMKCFGELLGGTMVLLVLGSLLAYWVFIFTA
jgi:hypothetical protein